MRDKVEYLFETDEAQAVDPVKLRLKLELVFRPEHVSGAENGAERTENLVERSAAVSGRACEKNDGAERSAEREVAERERRVERAELAAHSPLQRNISLI